MNFFYFQYISNTFKDFIPNNQINNIKHSKNQMNNSLSINQIQQNNESDIQLNNEILKNKQLQEEIKK